MCAQGLWGQGVVGERRIARQRWSRWTASRPLPTVDDSCGCLPARTPRLSAGSLGISSWRLYNKDDDAESGSARRIRTEGPKEQKYHYKRGFFDGTGMPIWVGGKPYGLILPECLHWLV